MINIIDYKKRYTIQQNTTKMSSKVMKPSDIELKKIDAKIPDHDLEVVAFWVSEQERLEWVARPIHDQVFNQVLSSTEKVSYTLQRVENNW